MVGLNFRDFKEYIVPKIGMKLSSIHLPIKKTKKFGFIDEAIEISKRTPGTGKYVGHEEWKTKINYLKFAQAKR
jgi:hypothetical protein